MQRQLLYLYKTIKKTRQLHSIKGQVFSIKVNYLFLKLLQEDQHIQTENYFQESSKYIVVVADGEI
jgi:hypothetical protein